MHCLYIDDYSCLSVYRENFRRLVPGESVVCGGWSVRTTDDVASPRGQSDSVHPCPVRVLHKNRRRQHRRQKRARTHPRPSGRRRTRTARRGAAVTLTERAHRPGHRRQRDASQVRNSASPRACLRTERQRTAATSGTLHRWLRDRQPPARPALRASAATLAADGSPPRMPRWTRQWCA